ncbi:MAG TPA: hypothetical protein ENF93_01490, partial [Ignisphaera sp.]|nr:hypothetical protein [Ignisphaera sp.]
MAKNRAILNNSAILIVRAEDAQDLNEIKAIAKEAGYDVKEIIIIKRIDSRCYLGKGKLAEIRDIISKNGISKVCIYDELKPRHYT